MDDESGTSRAATPGGPGTMGSRPRATLTGHTGRGLGGGLGAAGRPAGAGQRQRDDGTVRLWDPERGQELRTLTGHTAVWALAWGQLGTAGAGQRRRDGTVRLWDPERGQELRTLTGHTGPVRRWPGGSWATGRCWPAAAATARCGCGIRSGARSCAR